MRSSPGMALLAALVVFGCASGRQAGPATPARPGAAPGPVSDEIWPDSTWPGATPEEEGYDAARLAALLRRARDAGTPIHSLQVVRHGRLVLDAYFWPYSAEWPHDVASVTKSVTATLVGMAIAEGRLREDAPALALLGGPPSGDPGKGTIRVLDLLNMASGLECGHSSGEVELRGMQASADWLRFAAALPAAAAPGGSFAYCSPGFHLLSGVLTRVTGQPAAQYARERLFQPLGITQAEWPADPQGVSRGWGDLRLRPLDMARIGYLYLRGGRWGRTRLLPEEWVARSAAGALSATSGRRYGLGWWSRDGAQGHMFTALGRGGQVIGVQPGVDQVFVCTGGGYNPTDLSDLLAGALVRRDGPLPPNPAADSLLKDELRRIAAPPAPGVVAVPPANAPDLRGRRVELAANGIGLRAFRFTSTGGAEGTLELVFADRDVTLPVSLDGVGRFGTGLSSSPVLTQATWGDDGSLRVVLDMVAGINRFSLVVRTVAEGVFVDIREATGLVNETVPARVLP